MPRTLKVHLANASPDLVHEFGNFGEDAYRALGGNYRVSIEEVDASTKEFLVCDVPKREVRLVAGRIRKLGERYRNLILKVDEMPE